MAQWWSIALPRRGSRVRIPSRALMNKKRISFWISSSYFRVQSWTRSSNVSTPFRSAQNRGPPDLVRRLALSMKMKGYFKKDVLSFFESNPGLNKAIFRLVFLFQMFHYLDTGTLKVLTVKDKNLFFHPLNGYLFILDIRKFKSYTFTNTGKFSLLILLYMIILYGIYSKSNCGDDYAI